MKQIRTPVGTAPVLPVLTMSLGAYLCWFGVHYWRSDTAWPTDPLKAVLTGQPIPDPDRSAPAAALQRVAASAQNAALLGGVGAAVAAGGTSAIGAVVGPGAKVQSGGGGDAIAAAALKYVGAGYVYGGPADRIGNWDCSSFVSFVLGHDLGYKIPGGKWGDPGKPPHAHGPATTDYLMWGTPVSASQVAKGDLIVNSHHMGIVVADGTCMAAKTPQAGTGMSLYSDGFPGGSYVFRRVT